MPRSIVRAARLVTVCLLLFGVVGCRQPAQSQQRPPQRVTQPPQSGEIERTRETAITRAVKATEPAVVSISVVGVQRVQDPFWSMFGFPAQQQQTQSAGSGFVISADGYVVTNQHVVGESPQRIMVSFMDGEALEARLVGVDVVTDLALLKVSPPQPLPYLQFTTSAPIPGEWVIALGNPFGLFEAGEPSVSVGVVSAVGRNLQAEGEGRSYRDMIQTDAAINPGNSGGPLVNALGEVMGVNTAIYSRTGSAVGIGFAIPAPRARQIIEELRTSGTIDRSYHTGLDVLEMNQVPARLLRSMGLEGVQGLFVRSVEGPAARAGIQAYDVITRIGGRPVASANDYRARIFDYRPGDRVDVEVVRDGQRRRLTMTLGRVAG
jgi:serine protease Do